MKLTGADHRITTVDILSQPIVRAERRNAMAQRHWQQPRHSWERWPAESAEDAAKLEKIEKMMEDLQKSIVKSHHHLSSRRSRAVALAGLRD